MKKLNLLLVFAFSMQLHAIGQTPSPAAEYKGAPATLKSYKALYFIDDADESKIKGIMRNMNNAMDDPRLKGKLEVELVAFGEGVAIYKKVNGYDSLLLQLQKRGVILAQCENTMRKMQLSRDQLWPFVAYVPSGNGEIIIRQSEGWSVIHP